MEFSTGIGFILRQLNLDYSFAVVDSDYSSHRVSLGLRWGGTETGVLQSVKRPLPQEIAVDNRVESDRVIVQFINSMPTYRPVSRTVYEVERGDTLAKIAQKFYGNPKKWFQIKKANAHLVDPKKLEVGTRLIIPEN
jgi:nucleoid-associated protein YgaU